ncbi:hypothetical protein AVEN_249571-1 [Araneus ventricosus]|uniref:Uncharacterized protein n=1 Tax=Araneus ventricosus TaxID=182803 RepID=A0A4Y2VXA7_ARAVE|nr:hypothetical protein AVEN_249571-1 [Araneus ventricosus]
MDRSRSHLLTPPALAPHLLPFGTPIGDLFLSPGAFCFFLLLLSSLFGRRLGRGPTGSPREVPRGMTSDPVRRFLLSTGTSRESSGWDFSGSVVPASER